MILSKKVTGTNAVFCGQFVEAVKSFFYIAVGQKSIVVYLIGNK